MAIGIEVDPRYSVVVPVYNEEESLLELGRRLSAALDELDGPSEVVVVDDGSTDATPVLLAELERRDDRFRVIRLSRNFGHQVAITAGLDAAKGAAIVVMDGDLQHPPEVIHRLVERWRDGYDVVYAIADEHEQMTWFKRRSAALFYRLISRVARVEMPVGAGDFRLIDRRVRDAFTSMRERHRYVRGMFAWIGFSQTGVSYRSPARFGGKSKYTLSAMTRLAGDALFSFSQEPLMLVIKIGLGASVVSFVFGLATLISKLAGAYNAPGYVSIIVALAFVGGIQLVVLGFMGQYTARIFEEVKRRPLYFVDEPGGTTERERVEEPVESRQVEFVGVRGQS
jgi:dolichol-phosphate mannosyltransferase